MKLEIIFMVGSYYERYNNMRHSVKI